MCANPSNLEPLPIFTDHSSEVAEFAGTSAIQVVHLRQLSL